MLGTLLKLNKLLPPFRLEKSSNHMICPGFGTKNTHPDTLFDIRSQVLRPIRQIIGRKAKCVSSTVAIVDRKLGVYPRTITARDPVHVFLRRCIGGLILSSEDAQEVSWGGLLSNVTIGLESRKGGNIWAFRACQAASDVRKERVPSLAWRKRAASTGNRFSTTTSKSLFRRVRGLR